MNLIQILHKAESIVLEYETRDPEKIADYLGIRISTNDSLKELLGFFYQDEHYKVICCFASLSEKQRKSYIANALGHYFLYSKNDSFVPFTEDTFCRDNQKEKDANIFATSLLISDEKIMSLIYKGIIDEEYISEILSVDSELVKIKKELLDVKE